MDIETVGIISNYYLNYVKKTLSQEEGVEYCEKKPKEIPVVDTLYLASVVGKDNLEFANTRINGIKSYLKLNRTFHNLGLGKQEKIQWIHQKQKRFGPNVFKIAYQENQFRVGKITDVDGAIQFLAMYSRKYPEISDKLKVFHKGIMDRIKGIEGENRERIRRPYHELDKEGKIEVVEYVENVSLQTLRMFSTQRCFAVQNTQTFSMDKTRVLDQRVTISV